MKNRPIKRTLVELDEDLLRAAEILEAYARDLFASHTVRGRWRSMDGTHVKIKMEHDEMRRIARRFRRIVGTL